MSHFTSKGCFNFYDGCYIIFQFCWKLSSLYLLVCFLNRFKQKNTLIGKNYRRKREKKTRKKRYPMKNYKEVLSERLWVVCKVVAYSSHRMLEADMWTVPSATCWRRSFSWHCNCNTSCKRKWHSSHNLVERSFLAETSGDPGKQA